MSFLFLNPLTAVAVLLACAAGVGILYWLKPPPMQIIVPSALLWKKLVERQKKSRERLRWLISLLLALVIAIALGAGIAGLVPGGGNTAVDSLAIIVDNSASMAARSSGGSTRFDDAIAAARRLVSTGPDNLLVVDTAGQLGDYRTDNRRQALLRLEQLTLSERHTADLPDLELEPGTRVVVITDGVSLQSPPEGIDVVSVFEPATNVGIATFEAATADAADQTEALIEIVNASLTPVQSTLVVESDAGATLIRRALDLEPRERWRAVVNLRDVDSGTVTARVTTSGDSLADDDERSVTVFPRRPVTAALVTAGAPALELALRQLPLLQLVVAAPGEDLPATDLLLYDRWAPDEAPATPHLLIDPPERSWLAGTYRQGRPRTHTLTGTTHPVLRSADLQTLQVRRVSIPVLDDPTSSPWQVELAADAAPLLMSRTSDQAGAPPALWLTFALDDSTLVTDVAFPIFLRDVIDWLAGRSSTDLSSELAARDALARSRSSEQRILVNDSQLASDQGSESESAVSDARPLSRWWPRWLGLAAVLAALEGFAYQRRWTV